MSIELGTPMLPWLRERHWLALDVLAATGLFVLLVTGVVRRAPAFAVPGWVLVAACVLAAAPVAVRRRWPVTVLGIVLAANAVLTVFAVGGNPAVMVALAGYTVAVRHRPGYSLGWLAVALGLTVPAEVVPSLAGRSPLEWQIAATVVLASVLVLAAAWALGITSRARRLYVSRIAEHRTQRAVVEERLRIARELHDVITHGITVITVKASVASYLTDSRPDEVRDALHVIETTGRGTLTELRRMLGVLRADRSTEDPARTPAPGLADIPALAARAEDAGVAVALELPAGQAVSEALGLSAYRIVQESLTNVIKHAAPARCQVRVEISDTEMIVEVTDDGHHRRTPSAGHGIAGMRERATLFGGHLEAEPLPHRGFRVTARLPLTSPRVAAAGLGSNE